MKILVWVLAIASIPFGLFMSIVSYASHGLGLSQTPIGQVMDIVGTLAVGVSVVCAVFGIIKLRKGDVKKAVAFALAGVAYPGIILAGIYLDGAVFSMLMERDVANRKDEIYGENWDSAPAIGDIPELYVELLNEVHAIVKNQVDDTLMEFGMMAMPDYYGDASLDNIGFTMMDVNGDSVDELLVGTTAPAAEGGTAIFCIYCDPENPFGFITSMEGEVYYLHSAESDGTYLAEIGGRDAAWEFGALEGESIVDINYVEGAVDPAGRLTLDMIPFSQYK